MVAGWETFGPFLLGSAFFATVRTVSFLGRNYPVTLHLSETENFQNAIDVCKSMDGHASKRLHPRRLTWNLKMMVWKMIFLFKQVIFRFHVNFPGCSHYSKDSPKKTDASRPFATNGKEFFTIYFIFARHTFAPRFSKEFLFDQTKTC